MASKRLLANMNISPKTVKALREEGWDIGRVSQFLPMSASDQEILDFARREDRVVITQVDPFLLGQNSNGDLNGLFDVLHEGRTDRSSERTAEEKGLIQCGNLFTLGHGGFFKTTLSGRQFNVGGRGAKRCRERHDDHVIREAVAHIHRDDESGTRLGVGRMAWNPDQIDLPAPRK